jgi:cysteine sulfinate desulfinase/cysteine desulfurase-like protein/rhodanese-related sulfurtransferase
MTNEIYLDANATCPVLPGAIDAALDAMGPRFGNPSSSHAAGIRAKAVLDDARERARRVLGVGDGRLMFTSGATEGIQAAVLSVLANVRERQLAGQPCARLLVYGATEHKAVPESLAHWNRLLGTRLELVKLPVDGAGRHKLDVLRELAPDAAMVCTMAANNETGVISDLAAIESVLAETGSGAYWMVDCVQALGKIDLSLAHTRIDYAPFSGHKLCAPKGIGMLYARAGVPFTPLIMGGGQEGGQRSGTENMAGIAALGAVLKALEQGGAFRGHAELAACRERLASALRQAFPGILFNASFEIALPTTINFSVPGLSSRDVLDLFDAAGIRVSAGSACSASRALPSYVLEAMDVPEWRAASAVRLSFGPYIDDAFVDAACSRIARCGRALGAATLAPSKLSPGTGLLQLGAEGSTGWLVFDAAERRCVIIDPPASIAPRIAALASAQGYRVLAVLATGEDSAGSDALCAALKQQGMTTTAGWPGDEATVRLGDGSTAPALRIGGQVLVRLAQGDAACYLLGEAAGGTLAPADVRHAFSGTASAPGCLDGLPLPTLRAAAERLASLLGADTILCTSREADTLAWSTPAALARGSGTLAGLLAVQPLLARPALTGTGSVMQLVPEDMERFLQTHPEALLVDVREAAEQAAGEAVINGKKAFSVPMSRLAEHAACLLRGESRPLVFICRSGNRSARAAQALHRIGHAQAWQLAGGLALAR